MVELASGRCPICGRARSAGGHAKCSKQLQRQHLERNTQREAERAKRAGTEAGIRARYRIGHGPQL